ncbi:MAG: hypothetical protein J6Y62_00810 [Clostridia bacterium]|nr:hypothetical protein [Clostridia bacterium]
MNAQNVRNSWEAFKKDFGAYMFRARKLGQTIRWTSDSPEMMKSLLKKGAAEAEDALDKAVQAVEDIIKEVK